MRALVSAASKHGSTEEIAQARRWGGTLAERPVWLFSSGPVGDPRRKLVQKMAVDPVDLPEILELTRAREHRLFAGRLERRALSLPQRAALLLVRGLDGDFRDWAQIERWAGEIASTLLGRAADGRSG
ncbi:MAG: hypothetical protein KGJ43_02525 [Acidobacteriota bacterium]|nr:hypothetical protein [Acidobacteriota bacterium]